jgi:hypothetical protein
MKLINPISKRAFVNLFSDFILQKLGKTTKTIIQTTLYDNFIVIYGRTNSDVNLNMDEIKSEFFLENQELFNKVSINENLGTLNLIQYNPEYFKNNCYRYYLNLYNTERPLYHKNVLYFHFKDFTDSVKWKEGLFLEVPHNSLLPSEKFRFSPLQITSEFPYGYSLSIGRSLIYYAEYISHNIFNTISVENMKMLITNQKNVNDDQIIEVQSKSPLPSEKITSLILDNFDFDLDKFNNFFSDYDLCDEIKNVTSPKPWIMKNIIPQDLFVF